MAMNTEHFKKKLEQEKALLTEELLKKGKKVEGGVWEAVPEKNDEIESDENDLADRFEDYEKESEEVRVLSEKLSDADAALARIESGAYGLCRVCGEKIEEDRLEANPSATTCKKHLND